MKISEAIKSLNTLHKTWGDLDIYMEILEETHCPTCNEPETKIIDGFCDKIHANTVDSKVCVWFTCSDRMKENA